MIHPLGVLADYTRALRGFFRTPLSPELCRLRVLEDVANRDRSLLDLLRRGVYDQANSPYRKLLEHQGFGFDDVASLVAGHGVEGALERLFEAGVYLSIEEFKGLRPIERPGLHLTPAPADFDNPLERGVFEARTGGSTSAGRPVLVALGLIADEAALYHHYLRAFGLEHRPTAIWFPAPPGVAGFKCVMRQAKLGRTVDRWFSPRPPFGNPSVESFKSWAFLRLTGLLARRAGIRLPEPEFVPLDRALVVARWLAETRRRGPPAVLETYSSAGVRVCEAALEAGLDISGTFLRLGGEPYTQAKAQIVRAAGCRAAGHYFMAEQGVLGMACPRPVGLDDVHLMESKVAVHRHFEHPAAGGEAVGALYLTSLSPRVPKLMLNTASGDFGELERRHCGCALDGLGLTLHLRGIRSHEKLTSGGVSFPGTQLYELVEEILPRRFGGGPDAYQLVEQELDGRPRVSVLLSPKLGDVDPQEVIATVVQTLSALGGHFEMGAAAWRSADAIGVIRREPYQTPSGKVPPLWVRGLPVLREESKR